MSTESVETPTSSEPEQSDDSQSVDDVAETDVVQDASDDESGVKLESFPKELQDKLKPHIEKINKDFKRTYTKKFEELSVKEKQWMSQQQAIADQYETLRTTALEVLKDPSKLDAYRQIYADQLGGDSKANSLPPNIQTVDDLLKYTDSKIAAITQGVEQKVASQASQAIHQMQSAQRWETALDKIKAADPKFSKYEQIVATMIKSDAKYRSSYNGRNEHEILNKAYSDFKGMLREELDGVKKQTLDSVKAKKNSTTFMPTKPVGTDAQPRHLTPEEIIERVRQKVG